MEIQGKVWGTTELIFKNPVLEFHRINVKAGYKCSLHKHEHKWNGFYVVSGTLEIHVQKNDYALTDVTVLKAGDFTTVKPGEYHEFICTADCHAFELYWPELLSTDIKRKDHGGKNYDSEKEFLLEDVSDKKSSGNVKISELPKSDDYDEEALKKMIKELWPEKPKKDPYKLMPIPKVSKWTRLD